MLPNHRDLVVQDLGRHRGLPGATRYGKWANETIPIVPRHVSQRCDHSLEAFMIGVFVTFRYGSDFDAVKIRKIAETARTRFEGMPGLRSKAFTISPEGREAVNVYVWDSEDAAKAFFNEELLQRVTGLYGVRPGIAFVEIASLVDNAGKN
jgi:heme-degrading monooxygenase HmoA